MIDSEDTKRLMLEGKMKVGDRIKPMGMREHPDFVLKIDGTESITVLSANGFIDDPDEIYKIIRSSDSGQGYGEVYLPGGEDYDRALKDLNRIKGDYDAPSRENTKKDFGVLMVDQFCEKIQRGRVRRGDGAWIMDLSEGGRSGSEIVYNIENGFADAFAHISQGHGLIGQLTDAFPEYRYFSKERRSIHLGSHEVGSKDYHKLLWDLDNRLKQKAEWEAKVR